MKTATSISPLFTASMVEVLNSSSACRTCASVAVVCMSRQGLLGWSRVEQAHLTTSGAAMQTTASRPKRTANAIHNRLPSPASQVSHLQVHLGQRLRDADDRLQLAHSDRDGGDVAAIGARRTLALLVRVGGRAEEAGER